MGGVRSFFKILFLLIYCKSFAQELPPIENYSPKSYGAENQNWSISQSNNKNIYVANNSGLLEFNGAEWILYPSPNNSVIRSVSVIDDKIYIGCFREFGYWLKNDFGILDYYSLSDKIKESITEDEHFWNICNFDNWILFQSLHNIYIYNTKDQSFKIISSENRIPKVFKVDDSIYFQKLGEGVYKIENGVPLLISNHPIVQKNILVNIFFVDNKILFQTQEIGFYFLNDDGITKWDISANDIISSISVYSSIRLKNKNFVLGTISDGIYQLDTSGNIVNEINLKNGLNNNTVLSMYEDEEQNLWLGLDNGISVVNFEDPLRVNNDIPGVIGAVYASQIFGNNLYIGTNQGLYYKIKNSDTDFKFIEGTEGQVWCLKVYDNTLFCGHNLGTFVVNENKANLIVDVMGTWDIKPLNNNSNILLQGHYNGLNVIEKINNKWQFRNSIEGFGNSCRYFEFITDNTIFVNHEYKGVFKLSVNDDFTKVTDFSIEETAPKGLKSSILKYNNTILYNSKDGLFKYNEQKEKFVKDSIISNNLLGNDSYVSGKLIAFDQEKRLIGFTDKNIVFFSPGKLNSNLRFSKISITAVSRGFIAGYENAIALDAHKYLFGASKGYFILDLNKIVDNEKESEIKIYSIEKSILNNEKIPVSLKNDSEFKYKENNLFFKYALPEFDKYNEVNYQYQLEGIYEEWSNWSTISEVFFKNLPFGEYTFRVKAQIGDKLSKNIASYSFVINRPWYISNKILLLYFVLFLMFLGLVHSMYKRNFEKQKKILVLKKQREFVFSKLESEKEIMKLRNENLQHDIDNRTKELSFSAMSIIKKNELLNTIKKELEIVKDNAGLKPVINIINKNLTNTNDWEMFQEAFNNADSDFLKKVKNVHPTLTPNDLRLCAYLRLNLSSKEIAPLLNISGRSVEIKRYRLRKKMELEHEDSLVAYILKI